MPSRSTALTKAAFVRGEGGKLVVNKDLIGQDAAVLAKHAGVSVPADTELLFGETDESHPFVDHEQMMPFVPFVRVPERRRRHRPGQEIRARLQAHGHHPFAQCGHDHAHGPGDGRDAVRAERPVHGGLGLAAKAYLSFTIATPTGEGVTTPLTFTRVRAVERRLDRCAACDD